MEIATDENLEAPARRTSTSYAHDKAKILARLRRMEGQVRGVQRMVESDEYCLDILTQLSAIIAAAPADGSTGARRPCARLRDDGHPRRRRRWRRGPHRADRRHRAVQPQRRLAPCDHSGSRDAARHGMCWPLPGERVKASDDETAAANMATVLAHWSCSRRPAPRARFLHGFPGAGRRSPRRAETSWRRRRSGACPGKSGPSASG